MLLFDINGPYTKHQRHDPNYRIFLTRATRGRPAQPLHTWSNITPLTQPGHAQLPQRLDNQALYAMIYLFHMSYYRRRRQNPPDERPGPELPTLPIELARMVLNSVTMNGWQVNRLYWESPLWQQLLDERFWLSDTVYIDLRATRRGPQAGWTGLNHPLTYHFTLVETTGAPGGGPSNHRFWINPLDADNDWAWTPPNMTRWLAHGGDVKPHRSRLSHLCDFGFVGFMGQPRQGPLLHASPGPPNAQLPLHNAALVQRHPQHVGTTTMIWMANRAPNTAAFRSRVTRARRYNRVDAVDAMYRIWNEDIAISKVNPRRLRLHARAPLPQPPLLYRPSWSRRIIVNTTQTYLKLLRERTEAGLEDFKMRGTLHQPVLMVWCQMLDLRRTERVNFDLAVRRAMREVSTASRSPLAYLAVPSLNSSRG